MWLKPHITIISLEWKLVRQLPTLPTPIMIQTPSSPPDTILSSTLSTIKISYKGYGEYNLLDAFSMDAFPLDSHTYGCPNFQQTRKTLPSPQKQFGPRTFVCNGILVGQE